MSITWSEQDLADFSFRNWSIDAANLQREQVRQGANPVEAMGPCTAGDGLVVLSKGEKANAAESASRMLSSNDACIRFVPASGAASRMFALLRKPLSDSLRQRLDSEAVDFPFWTEAQRSSLRSLPALERSAAAVKWMLDEKSGLAHLPKGLIPFHQYTDGSVRNSFEEHVAEWQQLAGTAPIHFTVPQAFQAQIEGLFPASANASTSVQMLQTDTLAWDVESNDLARHPDGSLLFRPGGHGALLANLHAVAKNTSFILIRNIDNVVPAPSMAMRNSAESHLLGVCVDLTEQRDALLREADADDTRWKGRAVEWLSSFDRSVDENWSVSKLLEAIDRPIRVAGMVLNEGAPGGGPFWVRYSSGAISPAIVESAELPEGAIGQGTHFNPVDLICSVRRHDGTHYDLNEYAERTMFFTAKKDWQGRSIRILERPGLWNGAMAKWLTQFVEVPVETFAPVKTVVDLLHSGRRV